jgi:hypothetical protein
LPAAFHSKSRYCRALRVRQPASLFPSGNGVFRDLGVKLRIPLGDVLKYVSAEILVFLDLAE